MRIITGTARGMRLETLEGTATRPTAEKVKEALFSMIQFDIEGRRVLDLFGGSGQLALEALSRGAASATIIDASRDAASLIIRNAQKTKLYDRTRIITATGRLICAEMPARNGLISYSSTLRMLPTMRIGLLICSYPVICSRAAR